ncbi:MULTISPECIES: hypothetical protein [unclassified Brevibacterium]|uniref:hypothetical protein n=1 Tax=unclassified Brevibacterium TaxID=2614124 RepID=UPI0010F53378|nr:MULTISPECIES: hypothetical protein [unclassified Brevibacterium]MCM1014043.1 hypothetical protein [Brevibacterium sp. XM4083]
MIHVTRQQVEAHPRPEGPVNLVTPVAPVNPAIRVARLTRVAPVNPAIRVAQLTRVAQLPRVTWVAPVNPVNPAR